MLKYSKITVCDRRCIVKNVGVLFFVGHQAAIYFHPKCPIIFKGQIRTALVLLRDTVRTVMPFMALGQQFSP